jgi:aerobic-type carbon monoxide dehydrogenase small subunit (CoxS/CutS family)
MTDPHDVAITLNGTRFERTVEGRLLLSDFLRHDLEFTGTHVGCEHGVCGSCTVLVDGNPTRSCLMLAVQADGRAIETIEGLAPEAAPLSELQAAFRKHHALQCGYCTPGFLMTATALLRGAPMSRHEIGEALSGNLCRCTGYSGIVSAVDEVMNGAQPETSEKHGHAV